MALTAVSPTQARVGETMEEIIVRFGQVHKDETSRIPGTDHYAYEKNGFKVEVIIAGGKSIFEVYHRNDKEITNEDIKELLKANEEGHSWGLDRRTQHWTRSDYKLTAFREPGHPDFFFIEDIAAVKQAGKGKGDGAKVDGL